MALFIARRTDEVGYDEHDAAVFSAPTLGAAQCFVAERCVDLYDVGWDADPDGLVGFKPDGSNFVVELVEATNQPAFLLRSFNAG
ncbi:hypothetical protein [Streptomyces sp. SM12]|uniref:hypothetical protein n=1 Tax=Streptomyces sp. SM12 TaxID=1071602 RepID=UPI000CD54273|nr:hypothetical protein [Streptomyces sp. SM12]